MGWAGLGLDWAGAGWAGQLGWLPVFYVSRADLAGLKPNLNPKPFWGCGWGWGWDPEKSWEGSASADPKP